jgi:hypothetical protein
LPCITTSWLKCWDQRNRLIIGHFSAEKASLIGRFLTKKSQKSYWKSVRHFWLCPYIRQQHRTKPWIICHALYVKRSHTMALLASTNSIFYRGFETWWHTSNVHKYNSYQLLAAPLEIDHVWCFS